MHMHDKNTAGQCACDTDDQHVHREAKKASRLNNLLAVRAC